MSRSAAELSGAVSELRRRLGDTQPAFASRLGSSIRSVANYESDRPPKGRALVKLAEVAHRQGHTDLAGTFVAALSRELGVENLFFEAGKLWFEQSFQGRALRFEVSKWKPIPTGRPSNDRERIWVAALLAVLRSNKYLGLRTKILPLLVRPAKACLDELRDELTLDSDAALKLLRKGKSATEVAGLLDLDPEQVGALDLWLMLSEELSRAGKPARRN